MDLSKMKQSHLASLLSIVVFSFGCAPKDIRPDFSRYVWPPPPDEPRIQLVDIYYGRADVEASSGLQAALLGATPDPYRAMRKPHGVAFDKEGRLLVSDSGLGVVFRFDSKNKIMDVIGTSGSVTLRTPLGIDVGPDGTLYVADVGLKSVVGFGADGGMRAVFGGTGELENPSDVAVSPDGTRLFVADSKSHQIVVYEIGTGERSFWFGRRGSEVGEFNFPSALTFDPDGNLFVLDQMNSRVQVFTDEGETLDAYGSLGTSFGQFVRPKDIEIDEHGLIYVTDAAFGNLQLFDADFTLLTFVGSGGDGPGQFSIASGVAVRGRDFAIVDQMHARVQLFRFLRSPSE